MVIEEVEDGSGVAYEFATPTKVDDGITNTLLDYRVVVVLK